LFDLTPALQQDAEFLQLGLQAVAASLASPLSLQHRQALSRSDYPEPQAFQVLVRCPPGELYHASSAPFVANDCELDGLDLA